MENRQPVEGYFGREFRVIWNHCGVMAAWSRKTRKFCEQFLLVFKRPLTVTFSKFLSESFQRLNGRRCYVQISWNVADEKSENCVIYLTKKIGCLLNCRYCANRAQNLPGPAPNNVLTDTVLQISSKSVHCWRSYIRTRERRFLPRKVFSL